MYDYVTPRNLITLKFLKANNPLYSHIDINEEWLEQAFANDEEFCKYLIMKTCILSIKCLIIIIVLVMLAVYSHCDLPTLPVNEDCEHVECSSYTADDKSAFTVALHELLNIMTDPNFEAMSNPDKFPYGVGTFSTERPRKLTYRKYFNQRLLDVDGRFARDLDYLFVAIYIVEAKQVFDDGNNFAWRQKPARQFTASQARDQTVLRQFMRKDKAYSFMKNICGSPPYYQRTFYDLLAMIRQLGTPTWFFTLSAADLK